MLALDKWTANSNGRQATFWRKMRERKYTVTFIDQGYCFNAGEWTFPDYPLRGVYAQNEVYLSVRGWESFQPWLSTIEGMSENLIWNCAAGIPPEWYSSDWGALEELVRCLLDRRSKSTRAHHGVSDVLETAISELEGRRMSRSGNADDTPHPFVIPSAAFWREESAFALRTTAASGCARNDNG